MSGNLTPEQGHATGLPAVYDVGGEPRISSEELSDFLGYSRSRDIIRLIDRKRGELLCFGTLPRAKVQAGVSRQDGAKPSGVFGQIDREPHGISRHVEDNPPEVPPYDTDKPLGLGGRPSTPYLLNEGQAVLVAISSDAPKAAAVRREVIRVFVDWRAGRLGSRGPLATLEAMAPDATMSEVDLAEVIGLAHPSEMRSLIERRSRDLAKLGPLGRVELRSGGRGRPAKLHVFGRGQCLALAMAVLVEREAPPRAARGDEPVAETKAMRAVGALARRVEAQGADLNTLYDLTRRQAEELRALRRRLADVEALPARRPADRIAAPEPSDTLALFLADCTRHAAHGRVQASAIYGAWCEWCRIAGLHPGGQKSFGARLGAFGLARIKSGVHHYLGLDLLPKVEWATDSTAASGGGEA